MNINCVIESSLIVGLFTSIFGVAMAYIMKIKNINFIKLFLITFLIGLSIHILLEIFDFNQICFDKKCYSLICRA